MNDILKQILANKTPEEFAAEMLAVRKAIGPDNKYDISVEEALGITFGPVGDFKATTTSHTIDITLKTVNVVKIPMALFANKIPFNDTDKNSLAA